MFFYNVKNSQKLFRKIENWLIYNFAEEHFRINLQSEKKEESATFDIGDFYFIMDKIKANIFLTYFTELFKQKILRYLFSSKYAMCAVQYMYLCSTHAYTHFNTWDEYTQQSILTYFPLFNCCAVLSRLKVSRLNIILRGI